ncbi:MAG TPA: SUF system NifU family Fe-S cluster assembly protein [Candidatus Dormibacteraeota bacterium]|nr:SUF system NifU family Fe-S cluster assembly protein [Candidatus Dormibacteraeota bacterium]
MNDDLRELYQDVIIEHSKRPRNFHALDHGQKADGYNPLCGDTVTVYLDMDGERVSDCAFQGHGCAISTAAASVMTETLKGKTRAEADAIFRDYHDLVTGGGHTDPEQLGKLAVFAGVSEFPARVKCATLCWHTARAALEGKEEPVSTE